MKSPQIVHFRCLDTFGVRDVAQSYGAGATGVRLTESGLAAYVRPSRRKPAEPEVVPTPVEVALPRAPRAPLPSLVTIEMGLRRPTTWAVLLLTLGVSLGVVIARVASGARPIAPAVALAAPAPAADRVSWPQAARAGVAPIISTLATTTIRADLPDPTALQAHASSARTRALHSSHSSSRHHALALAGSPSTDEDDTTVATPAPAAAPAPAPAVADESDDSIGAASAASARAQKELSDAL